MPPFSDPPVKPGRDPGAPAPWLQVNSLAELEQHEPEVLARMANTPNGGQLFMTHPFLFLADLGVELSDQARQEILATLPQLSALSPIPYYGLKAAPPLQNVTFTLTGLFPRSAP